MATIVIIDDDIDFLFQLKMMLGKTYSVVTFNKSDEGLKYLFHQRPDLVILDLMIDTYDEGFVNARKIRKLYPDLPIILLTAVGSETGVSFSDPAVTPQEQFNVNKVLDKGCPMQVIQRTIEKYL